jgi:hypothetical protein
LVANGADPTVRSNGGETAADRARRFGMHEVARFLDRSESGA